MGYGYGIQAAAIRSSCDRKGAARRKKQNEKAEALAVRISEMIYKKGMINMGISEKKVLRMAGGDRYVCYEALQYLQDKLRYNVERREVKTRSFFGRAIRKEQCFVISAYAAPGFGRI